MATSGSRNVASERAVTRRANAGSSTPAPTQGPWTKACGPVGQAGEVDAGVAGRAHDVGRGRVAGGAELVEVAAAAERSAVAPELDGRDRTRRPRPTCSPATSSSRMRVP